MQQTYSINRDSEYQIDNDIQKQKVTFNYWVTQKDKAKLLQYNDGFLTIWRWFKEKAEVMFDQAQADFHSKQYNHKLSGMENMMLSTDIGERNCIIRWAKIPTFPRENKIRFHCLFFINVDYWNIHEIPAIKALCMNLIDRSDLGNEMHYKKDAVSIYISGKQRGAFQYKHIGVNRILRKYNTMVFNSNTQSIKEAIYTILNQLRRFIGQRTFKLLQSVKDKVYMWRTEVRNMTLYGVLRSSWKRLIDLRDDIIKLQKHYFIEMKRHKASVAKRKKLLEISNSNLSLADRPKILSEMSEDERKKHLGKEFFNLLRKKEVEADG